MQPAQSDIPVLVKLYQRYTKDVYGIDVWVQYKLYARFTEAERIILQEDVSLVVFTKTVLTLWKPFVTKKRNWTHLPVNAFLGNKAYQWFQDVYAKRTVNVIAGIARNNRVMALTDEINICLAVCKGLIKDGEYDTLHLSSAFGQVPRPTKEASEIAGGILGVKPSINYNVMRIRYEKSCEFRSSIRQKFPRKTYRPDVGYGMAGKIRD